MFEAKIGEDKLIPVGPVSTKVYMCRQVPDKLQRSLSQSALLP